MAYLMVDNYFQEALESIRRPTRQLPRMIKSHISFYTSLKAVTSLIIKLNEILSRPKQLQQCPERKCD